MSVFNAIIPIAAGNEAAAREFARSIMNEREPEFAAFVGAAGIIRETWTMLPTPMGTFLLFWFDGDVEAAMVDLATNTSEFAQWFRAQIGESQEPASSRCSPACSPSSCSTGTTTEPAPSCIA